MSTPYQPRAGFQLCIAVFRKPYLEPAVNVYPMAGMSLKDMSLKDEVFTFKPSDSESVSLREAFAFVFAEFLSDEWQNRGRDIPLADAVKGSGRYYLAGSPKDVDSVEGTYVTAEMRKCGWCIRFKTPEPDVKRAYLPFYNWDRMFTQALSEGLIHQFHWFDTKRGSELAPAQ